MIYEFIFKFIKQKSFWFILYIIFQVIIDSVLMIMTQIFNKDLINHAQLLDVSYIYLLFYVFLYSFCQHVSHILHCIIYKIHFSSIDKIEQIVKQNLFKYVIQHSINFFNNSFSGTISNKINNISRDIADLIGLFIYIATFFANLLLIPIVYSQVNYKVTILFIFIMFIYVISIKKFQKLSIEANKQVSEEYSVYTGIINDNFTNVLNIKAFPHENYEKNRIEQQITKIEKAKFNLLKINNKIDMISLLIFSFLFFSVITSIGILLLNKKIDMGIFTTVTILLSISRWLVNELSRKILNFTELRGKIENNLSSIFKPIEIKDKEPNKEIKITSGKIEFKNITFGYKK